jgi:ABC-type Fe3+-siderophore transport system permease subunit
VDPVTLELDESRSLRAQFVGLTLAFVGSVTAVVLDEPNSTITQLLVFATGAGYGMMTVLVYVGAVDAPVEL